MHDDPLAWEPMGAQRRSQIAMRYVSRVRVCGFEPGVWRAITVDFDGYEFWFFTVRFEIRDSR